MTAAHGQCYVCFSLCGSVCLIYIAIALRQQLKLTKEYKKQTKHNASEKYPKLINPSYLLRNTKFAFPQNYWLSIANILKRNNLSDLSMLWTVLMTPFLILANFEQQLMILPKELSWHHKRSNILAPAYPSFSSRKKMVSHRSSRYALCFKNF